MQDKSKYYLNHSDYKTIADFIKEKYDFDISDFAFSITKRRIEDFFAQYNASNLKNILTFLKKENFFTLLKEYMIVPTTSLFRDPEMWKKLAEKYLKKLPDSSNPKIWLPNISFSDDELATILIILNILNIKNFEITISSFCEIENLRNQKFEIPDKKFDSSKQNFIKFSDINFEDFFEHRDNNYYLKNSLVKNIKFVKHKLEDNPPEENYFDLIIARNRLLYLNLNAHYSALDNLYKSLKTKGFLIIGLQEDFHNWELKNKFSAVDKENKIFQKKK